MSVVRRLIRVPEEKILSADGVRALLERVTRLCTGGGGVQIYVRSRWTGNLRWARNEITSAGDTVQNQINISRHIDGGSGNAITSRTDDDSLRRCVERAEYLLRHRGRNEDAVPLREAERYVDTKLWRDSTYQFDATARAALQHRLVEPVIAEQLLSAGYLELNGSGNGYVNSNGLFAYMPGTRAEYSVTVRNAKGNGSGWAGTTNEDWSKIDAPALTSVAMDKCKRSAEPFAMEPGRYTVILEPQAVCDLMAALVQTLYRPPAEMGQGPWADRGVVVPPPPTTGDAGEDQLRWESLGMSKIGQRVLDPRISISADPMDPEMPQLPFSPDGTPNRAVTWIENGVLRQLAYERQYALARLNKPDPLNNNYAFRMSGGSTSLDEMVRTTARGLLITRFVNVRWIDYDSILLTGTTSDGVWLIERGEITRPVKNFRFRDSPLFAFNNVDLMGMPVRAFRETPAIVPPVRVRDFSLTSLADAV